MSIENYKIKNWKIILIFFYFSFYTSFDEIKIRGNLNMHI